MIYNFFIGIPQTISIICKNNERKYCGALLGSCVMDALAISRAMSPQNKNRKKNKKEKANRNKNKKLKF